MASITITKSRADYLLAIISAVIAALTYFLGQGTEITVPIIIGSIIAFLTAIINISKEQPAPTPAT